MQTDTPNIRAVQPGEDHRLTVTWKGGAESSVDVGELISSYAVFAPLRGDASAFRAVSVGEWGWSVHWSDDMQISSDSLWRLALDQGSKWLRAWREARGLSQADAAAALGVSPRMWRYYETAEHLLPKTVRLACVGFDAQQQAA